jgi:hypothetical protein
LACYWALGWLCSPIIGFDRDRVFYPTLLIVIATYYALFAIIGCSRRTLLIESLVVSAFSLVSREILS